MEDLHQSSSFHDRFSFGFQKKSFCLHLRVPFTSKRLLNRRSKKAFVILLWIFLCCKTAGDSLFKIGLQTRNDLLYETFLYYNPLVLLAVMIWLWGINLRVFSASKISYAKVFDLDGTHLTSREIWKIALWITLIVLTSMTSFLYFSAHNSYLAASQPVLLYSVLPLMLVLPLDGFFLTSRLFFLRTVARIFIPLQPITFADFFVADVLTSMAKVLSDVERATCRMFHGQVATLSWFEPDSTCGSHSVWIPCILALPYLCRFLQCLRQYSDTRDKSCVFNALKYATSFPVILLSALKYHVALEVWHGVYRPLWLISGLVNTCFSFYWDIRRDWDLNFFSSLCNLKYHVLRPNVLYSNHSVAILCQTSWAQLTDALPIVDTWIVGGDFNNIESDSDWCSDIRLVLSSISSHEQEEWDRFLLATHTADAWHVLLLASIEDLSVFLGDFVVYYGAIGTNLLLRWAWTYKLSAHLRHNYITVFLMTALEMLRRFQWIFFRVESEWSKMSRSNLQTSAADSVKNAEVLIPLAEYNV
ncbi:hypothetical protein L7F22_056966 [Adiantum nelumboides]|nr:hypothetical protein [Adiantum nelumboides]